VFKLTLRASLSHEGVFEGVFSATAHNASSEDKTLSENNSEHYAPEASVFKKMDESVVFFSFFGRG